MVELSALRVCGDLRKSHSVVVGKVAEAALLGGVEDGHHPEHHLHRAKHEAAPGETSLRDAECLATGHEATQATKEVEGCAHREDCVVDDMRLRVAGEHVQDQRTQQPQTKSSRCAR